MSVPEMGTPSVEVVTEFRGTDLGDLCDAAIAAIEGDGGFGWLKAPPRHIMEAHWKGLLLVPDRYLCIARLDGTIAGSALLVRPPRQNEAQAATAHLSGAFIAPWARHRGLGRMLVTLAEATAREHGGLVLNLDLRATQKTAIRFFEALGYRRWGIHPAYARVEGRVVAGHFFWKPLTPEAEP
ncbi:MAG TPA: GNAT family N-acetyltransferase [Stellaceae bacterium]|nr:GNAT family N-acetyltransferase [Stellaceae bacterium]